MFNNGCEMNRLSDNSIRVLVTGRTPQALAGLEQILGRQPDIQYGARHIVNGTLDPLQGVRELPDVLVMDLDDNWKAELAALRARPIDERPATIAIGDGGDARMMRDAMNAGVRDFLTHPCSPDELLASVHHLANETRRSGGRSNASMTAVINAKGGSGASLVASNLAHVVATTGSNRTLLVDMDLQFGCLPTYLNVTPRNGLLKALELVETLDAVAIEGYVQSHESGLDILAAAPDSIVLPQDVDDARVTALFDVLAQAYDYLIVDLPRYIETASASVLDRADRILVVTQQSIAHLRDTRRLMSILQSELGIAGERLVVLVNRLDKKSAVSLSDIRTALHDLQIRTLPNDYRRVTESINLGVPLLELGRRTVIAKQFVDLADIVRPQGGGETKNAPARGGASFLHWLGN